jgi:hypothetical protein
MHTYIHTRTHTYIHTYTHTHTHSLSLSLSLWNCVSFSLIKESNEDLNKKYFVLFKNLAHICTYLILAVLGIVWAEKHWPELFQSRRFRSICIFFVSEDHCQWSLPAVRAICLWILTVEITRYPGRNLAEERFFKQKPE